ncbi:hypothetical protein LSH36_1004g00019 [Paralvinella palmiformis]|uniref:Swi5-dependent recombination DNA repair protein 1 homolog n=1 Tax=Paralvinella palmiformis TaxID=53620 RepID=A0AAD9IW73_9ANNE|nr:hypothetical protein LSH36_1004g00019 [Paralvinella palmiformis]
MSEALKARLKKCGRFYHSPITAVSSSPSADITHCTTSYSPLSSAQEHLNKSCLMHRTSAAFKSPVVNAGVKDANLQTPTSALRHPNCHISADEPIRRTLVGEFTGDGSPPPDSCRIELSRDLAKSNSQHLVAGLKRKRNPADDCDAIDRNDVLMNTSQPATTGGDDSLSELLRRRKELMLMITEKGEKVRKLKMVKLYRSKHSLQMLDALVNKWKMVSQQAIIRLHNLTQEPRPTLTQLIDHLNIDYEMIGYCVDEESFVCDQ